MRRKLIAANWKLNGSTAMASGLVGDIQDGLAELDNGVEVVIIPPAIYATLVNAALAESETSVGIQDVSRWNKGAYTGEVSAPMAHDVGCRYALVGHSERRELLGETDTLIADKVDNALSASLNVILCVGETEAQREAGAQDRVVGEQLKQGLSRVSDADWLRVVVAYEPVWAIGTGRTATAEDAQSVHAVIRQTLNGMGAPAEEMTLLYGGSVKPDNAKELFAQPDIDGGLIGGASLSAPDFLAICRAA
ncbi:triose-phosphate isomerase [Tamilnaduibacter salinus]|uniref:Triosephosphate isomerase n=1 Tax=Tamilnaduibacter salinus TaxID=1484056 RepID=A0A2A2I6A8_9GAMM|nr:triose-phosphate isomerase [Tamilnaduibacter salinus]PAV26814.1 triose-phosphate isomerase [Tamilnaduibacter salinus]